MTASLSGVSAMTRARLAIGDDSVLSETTITSASPETGSTIAQYYSKLGPSLVPGLEQLAPPTQAQHSNLNFSVQSPVQSPVQPFLRSVWEGACTISLLWGLHVPSTV